VGLQQALIKSQSKLQRLHLLQGLISKSESPERQDEVCVSSLSVSAIACLSPCNAHHLPVVTWSHSSGCKDTIWSCFHSGSVALEQGIGSESSHPRQAEILDQLSLFQFLQGKLPEAEMHARRSLAVIQNHFEIGDPAVCMCELRLGAILFSKLPLSRLLLCLVTMTGT